MKRKIARFHTVFMLSWVMTGSALITGCDGNDCGTCGAGDVEVVVEVPCCGEPLPFQVDVLVGDEAGYQLAGASVELIIAIAPEQRYVGTTDGNGVARFFVESPPGVTMVVYACAPHYECGAVDVYTSPETPDIQVRVVLRD